MALVDTMTDDEVDFILERFDQTKPELQRRIIAEFAIRAEMATSLLGASRDMARVVRAIEKYVPLADVMAVRMVLDHGEAAIAEVSGAQ